MLFLEKPTTMLTQWYRILSMKLIDEKYLAWQCTKKGMSFDASVGK